MTNKISSTCEEEERVKTTEDREMISNNRPTTPK
jgi:hypothetical protein